MLWLGLHLTLLFHYNWCIVVTEGSYISIIPGGGIGVGDLSSLLTFKLKKGVAIDIDHRVTKQQYTPLLPLNGIEGGRKTSCMACQKKKKFISDYQSIYTMK